MIDLIQNAAITILAVAVIISSLTIRSLTRGTSALGRRTHDLEAAHDTGKWDAGGTWKQGFDCD